MILLGTSMYIIGFCIPPTKRKKYSIKCQCLEKLYNRSKKTINNKYIAFVLLLIIIGMFHFTSNALMLATLDTHYITEDRFENMFEGNRWAYLYSLYLLKPLTFYMFAVLSLAIIKRIHINYFSLSVYILLLIENSILAGGRSIFLIFAIFLLIFYRILNPILPKFRFTNIATITIICTLIFTCMIFMNSYRKNGEFSFTSESLTETIGEQFEQITKYSTLPMVLLDYSLKNDYVSLMGGYQYGRATFLGIDNYVQPIINKFGVDTKSGYYIVNYLQQQWISCSPSERYNYAYTAIFYHYLDFGWFGVIIIPLLFGIIFRLIILRIYHRVSFPWLILVGISTYMMLHTVFSNAFIKQDICLFIAILYFWDYIDRKKIVFVSHTI